LNRGRVENRAELIPLLRPAMKARTTADWVAAFEDAAVPCGPINTVSQMFADPQVVARGLQMSLQRADGTSVPAVANPIRMSETPVAYERAPPKLGEHTGEVLGDLLGLKPEEIAALRKGGIAG
jgi:crotonobetainyl-CoA:carnitine CoA-transferase CaiB-like acyl-CoA transferase